ncbi:MAG TPA: hypothetical protein VMV86_04700, partial [Methanosarcinales archaeon]|nr:hypothetical protein [Methanosarcinales archaeon]
MYIKQISDIIITKYEGGESMNTTSRNSIIWAIVLLVEVVILKLAKSMRLWIYIALPIIAGFAAMEFFKSHGTLKCLS